MQYIFMGFSFVLAVSNEVANKQPRRAGQFVGAEVPYKLCPALQLRWNIAYVDQKIRVKTGICVSLHDFHVVLLVVKYGIIFVNNAVTIMHRAE